MDQEKYGVTVTTQGPVSIVTLRREAKRNSINDIMTAAIDAVLNRLEEDKNCAVIIITGGSAMFSAGTDIVATAGEPTELGGEYGIIRRRHKKPMIAAVEGFAFGGGMEIVLACDLVIASRTAVFGLPELKHSFVPTCGGMFRPLRALPLNVVKQIILTGDPLGAERAYAVGFVNELTDPGSTLSVAITLAGRIALNGPVAVRECLAGFDRIFADDETRGWDVTSQACAVVWKSEDAIEGQKAFAERRAPVWRGK